MSCHVTDLPHVLFCIVFAVNLFLLLNSLEHPQLTSSVDERSRLHVLLDVRNQVYLVNVSRTLIYIIVDEIIQCKQLF